MENSEEYGPALPPGMIATKKSDESTSSRPKIIGPSVPGNTRKSSDSDDLSDEGQLMVKMESDLSPEHSDSAVGPMPSEMATEGETAAKTADEFEKRSKRMKDKLGVKVETDDGPVKREEWMTELPSSEMGKNFGLSNRQFSKGSGDPGDDSKDRSAWTDTPSIKKEKESKGKKRKREEEKALSARDQKLHQQVDEYNKDKRSESLLDIHNKKLKKKKNGSPAPAVATTANGSQALVAAASPVTQTTTNVENSQAALSQQQQQQPQQQQPHLQQYYQLTDEIRDSLDLLSEQQQQKQEYYSSEFNNGEFNEAKPLADLLMTPSVVTYNQDGTVFTQAASTSFSSSQMIAQAYSHAQQMSSTTAFTPQAASTTNSFSQSIPAQPGSITATVVNSGQGQEMAVAVQGQVQQQAHGIEVSGQTVQVNGHTVQNAAAAGTNQINAQQVQNYAEAAYATQITGDAAAAVAVQQQQQQQQGQVVTFSLAGGQNMIIASPHTQQAGQNYVIASQGHQPGQNIVIAAQGQHAGVPAGNFIVKAEGDELGQNIVLTQQNLQQLGQNVVLTQDGSLATAGGENVILTTPDGQRQQAITGQRTLQAAGQVQHGQPQQQQVLAQTNIPLQAAGGAIPQVSLVLPQVSSLFPQIQGTTNATSSQISPQAFLQLCNKVDKMIQLVTDSQNTLFEMNKRVERIESQLLPHAATPVGGSPSAPVKINKPKPPPPRPIMSVASTPPANNAAAMSKASLKAALSSYLTISEYTATDELKRSDSNSDLFIPVGTMSMVQGQNVIEAPSPSDTPETASSTVQEISADQEMIPVVLGNMASQGGEEASQTQDINVPIVDSRSDIAVTVYEEGAENQKYELGPGSSKEPNARFSNTSNTPKTVILDPRFWDILVEDFQKNMTSDQIINAMANTRKPLVRSIGTSEISICSTVLKEAESACQGRRERLAKELVFRIFTLGEVYDRNVSGVFYINGKKMENKNKALDPAKMAAIHYLVMKYPPSVVDNPRLERLVWKNCVDRINDSLRRIYNWIHKIVDVNNIIEKLPTDSIMMP